MKKSLGFFVAAGVICAGLSYLGAEEAVESAIAGEQAQVEQPKTEAPVVEQQVPVEQKEQQSSALQAEIKIGSGIENREVIGETEIFDSATISKVFCWSKITGAAEPTQVKHRWYLGDKLMSEVSLDIKYPSHRTWSTKTIDSESKGAWKVEVVDSEGKIIGFKTFSVQ